MDWSIDSIGFYVVWAIMVVHEQYFSLYIIFTSNQTKSKIISLFLFILFFSLFTLFCWVFLVFYYNIKGETGNVATFRLLRFNAKIKKNKQTNKQKYLWKTWLKKKTQYPTPKKKLFQWDSNSWSLELKASALSTRPICSWTKEGLFSIRSWWNITVCYLPLKLSSPETFCIRSVNLYTVCKF